MVRMGTLLRKRVALFLAVLMSIGGLPPVGQSFAEESHTLSAPVIKVSSPDDFVGKDDYLDNVPDEVKSKTLKMGVIGEELEMPFLAIIMQMFEVSEPKDVQAAYNTGGNVRVSLEGEGTLYWTTDSEIVIDETTDSVIKMNPYTSPFDLTSDEEKEVNLRAVAVQDGKVSSVKEYPLTFKKEGELPSLEPNKEYLMNYKYFRHPQLQNFDIELMEYEGMMVPDVSSIKGKEKIAVWGWSDDYLKGNIPVKIRTDSEGRIEAVANLIVSYEEKEAIKTARAKKVDYANVVTDESGRPKKGEDLNPELNQQKEGGYFEVQMGELKFHPRRLDNSLYYYSISKIVHEDGVVEGEYIYPESVRNYTLCRLVPELSTLQDVTQEETKLTINKDAMWWQWDEKIGRYLISLGMSGSNLNLNCPQSKMGENSVDIHFTIDGSEPTETSPKMRWSSGEYGVDETRFSTTFRANTNNVVKEPKEDQYILPDEWKRGGDYVIKVKAFAPGYESSDTLELPVRVSKLEKEEEQEFGASVLGKTLHAEMYLIGQKTHYDMYTKIELLGRKEANYPALKAAMKEKNIARFITLRLMPMEGEKEVELKEGTKVSLKLKRIKRGDLSILDVDKDKIELYLWKDGGLVRAEGQETTEQDGIFLSAQFQDMGSILCIAEKNSDDSLLSMEELRRKAAEVISFAEQGENLRTASLESKEEVKERLKNCKTVYEDEKATKENLLEVLYSLEETLLTLESEEGDFPEKQILRSEMKKAKTSEVRAFRDPESLLEFDRLLKEIEDTVLNDTSVTPELCREAVEKIKTGIQNLKNTKDFATQPDLEDGIYEIPVQLRQFGDENLLSMGNGAVHKTGFLIVERGRQDLQIKLQPMSAMSSLGHLLKLDYYSPRFEKITRSELSEYGFDVFGGSRETKVLSTYEGPGIDGDRHIFPGILSIPVEVYPKSPRRYIRVSVDAMNAISNPEGDPYKLFYKDAVLMLDYRLIRKVEKIDFSEREMEKSESNKETLRIAISEGEILDTSRATAEDISRFKEKMEQARKAIANENASPEEVAKAERELRMIIHIIETYKPDAPGGNGGNYGYDIDTEVTGEELPDGKRYEVPVTLWHYYQDQPSMGNEAMEGTITVVEKDGKATYRITFKGLKMPFGGKELYGHLTQFFIYDDQAASSNMNNAKKATLIETMEDVGLDGNTHTFPRVYQFTRNTLREKEIYVKVNVDAMTQIGKEMGQEGMGIQNAILKLNWDAVKDNSSSGGGIGSYDSETDKTGIQIQVLGSESTEEGVKVQASEIKEGSQSYQKIKESLNKFSRILEEGNVKAANKEVWKGASVRKFVAYDIKLKKGEESYQLKDGKKALMKLPIPKDFNKESLAVFYVGDKGEIEVLEGKVKEGYYEVEVEHFSHYVLAEVEKVQPIALNVQNRSYRAYVKGYPNGSFKPEEKITRAEAAYMMAQAIFSNKELEGADSAGRFADTESSAWYSKAVNVMADKGILRGYEGNVFKPNQAISRAEYIAMAVKVVNAGEGSLKAIEFKDLKSNHWAYEVIKTALSNGYVKGYQDGSFRPDAKITRAEAVTMMNAFTKRPATEEQLKYLEKMNKFSDVPEGHWAYWQILSATNDIVEDLRRDSSPFIKKTEDEKKKEQVETQKLEDGVYQVPAEMMKAIGKAKPKDHSMSNNAIDHNVIIEVKGEETHLYLTMKGMVIKAFGDKKGHLRQAWYYPSVKEYYRSLEEKKDLSKAVEVIRSYKDTAFESDEVKDFPQTIKFPIERYAEFVYIKVEVDAMTAIGGVGSPDAAMKLDWNKIEKYKGELPK